MDLSDVPQALEAASVLPCIGLVHCFDRLEQLSTASWRSLKKIQYQLSSRIVILENANLE